MKHPEEQEDSWWPQFCEKKEENGWEEKENKKDGCAAKRPLADPTGIMWECTLHDFPMAGPMDVDGRSKKRPKARYGLGRMGANPARRTQVINVLA